MTIKAYKGFNKDWTCTPNGKPFQYAVGETYKHDGPVTRCGVGFHSCENPFDVLKYYDTRNGNRFAEVEVGGQTARGNNDTKIASAEITIKAELKLPELFARGVAYLVDAGKALHRDMMKTHTETMTVAVANGNATSGYGANSATSGTRANSATSGEGANSATCGAWCNSSVKGENAIAAALGPNSTASAEEGGAIMLAHYADDGTLKHVFASKVGKNGIKPGVTYKLNSRGKPVEAK